MQFNPYLLFNNDCAEAFKFSEQTLGGKIEANVVMCVDRSGIPWMVNCE